MKRSDRIKLNFTRNWKLSGKERLSGRIKLSAEQKARMKDAITWLVDEDIAIYANPDSYIEWSIFSGGTYENEIGKLIRISLKSGDSALDIGANIGLQSLRMAQSVGSTGHVYGFEPLDHLREKAAKNLRLNTVANVMLLPFALSDSESEMEYAIDKTNWNQGTFSLGDQSAGSESQKIRIKIADELDEVKNIEKLKLVKIDVEGFEFNVLKGLKQTLAKHKPRVIFEYDKNYWVKNGQHIEDCFDFLRDLGYMLYQITAVGCELINQVPDIEGGNIFCLQDA